MIRARLRGALASCAVPLALLVALASGAVGAPRRVEAQAAAGTVRDDVTIRSRVLDRAVRYSVYLPAGYDASGRRTYPVVYLLHGGGGDHRSWLELRAAATADSAIAQRAIPPVVLIMPDAGTSRYLNSDDGEVRYEDFFVQELMPAIEAAYRVSRDRAGRAVAGFSMGGYAALFLGLRHPDMFAAVAALSGAVYTDSMTMAMSQAQWDQGRGAAFGVGRAGAARITPGYRAYDPLRLAATTDTAQLRGIAIYLDCGDDDPRNEGNAALHVLLRRRGIAHEYRVRDGGHTPAYWISGLPSVLAFLGQRIGSAR